MNPVFLLDEVDKVGSDWRGDPSSALLEVLDPAQNHTFRDHYLEVDLDLSDVLFLATANVLDTIPGPLLDRMEVVRLDGYTEDEKVGHRPRPPAAPPARAQRPAARRGRGRRRRACAAVVTGYTREAGVRDLERQLGKVLRKVGHAGGRRRGQTPIHGRCRRRSSTLPRPAPRSRDEVAERSAVPGVATGLAVTGAGGDVLFVEATAMPRRGRRARPDPHRPAGRRHEGVGADRPLLRALAPRRRWASRPGTERRRFHVHFPAGAVPKDGPSAGITMTTALVSLLTGRPVRPDGRA